MLERVRFHMQQRISLATLCDSSQPDRSTIWNGSVAGPGWTLVCAEHRDSPSHNAGV